jgi:ABC-type glycerol-3-phosphate transport system permease component
VFEGGQAAKNVAQGEGLRIAGGTMVMLPVLVFSLVVRRFLISGLIAGAIRG